MASLPGCPWPQDASEMSNSRRLCVVARLESVLTGGPRAADAETTSPAALPSFPSAEAGKPEP